MFIKLKQQTVKKKQNNDNDNNKNNYSKHLKSSTLSLKIHFYSLTIMLITPHATYIGWSSIQWSSHGQTSHQNIRSSLPKKKKNVIDRWTVTIFFRDYLIRICFCVIEMSSYYLFCNESWSKEYQSVLLNIWNHVSMLTFGNDNPSVWHLTLAI